MHRVGAVVGGDRGLGKVVWTIDVPLAKIPATGMAQQRFFST